MDGRILIGIDEAGYGPNLGPLVITATVWRIPIDLESHDLITALSPTFAARPFNYGDNHIPIGDSKLLYSPVTGLRTLEAGVLSMLGQVESVGNDLAWFVNVLCGSKTLENLRHWPWYQLLCCELRKEVPTDEALRLCDLCQDCLGKVDIQLLRMSATLFTERDFNASVAKLGSKGQLLSTSSLKLAHDVARNYDCPIEIFCDRQGGRKKYLPVLLETMPDSWFETIIESEKISSYRTQSEPRWTFHFTVGGDRFPPVGLASMTAKFLRERLMAILNEYWLRHIPGIHPTAGYPQDAKRFRTAIEAKAFALGFEENTWWRVC